MEVEAPEALILGIGAAIGKQDSMCQHFVNEDCKSLGHMYAKFTLIANYASQKQFFDERKALTLTKFHVL